MSWGDEHPAIHPAILMWPGLHQGVGPPPDIKQMRRAGRYQVGGPLRNITEIWWIFEIFLHVHTFMANFDVSWNVHVCIYIYIHVYIYIHICMCICKYILLLILLSLLLLFLLLSLLRCIICAHIRRPRRRQGGARQRRHCNQPGARNNESKQQEPERGRQRRKKARSKSKRARWQQ